MRIRNVELVFSPGGGIKRVAESTKKIKRKLNTVIAQGIAKILDFYFYFC